MLAGAGLRLLAAAALVLPAACAPSGNLAEPPAAEAEEARRALQYAGAQGPVLAVIGGGPLARPDRVGETLRAIDRGVVGLDVAFTTDPELASRPEFKLVVLADPARPDDPAAACAAAPEATASDGAAAAPPGATSPGDGRPSVLAVFCEGERPIAGALADVEAADPGAEPDYDRLVYRSTAALFPDDYWAGYGGFPFSLGLGVGSGGRTSVGVGVGIGL